MFAIFLSFLLVGSDQEPKFRGGISLVELVSHRNRYVGQEVVTTGFINISPTPDQPSMLFISSDHLAVKDTFNGYFLYTFVGQCSEGLEEIDGQYVSIRGTIIDPRSISSIVSISVLQPSTEFTAYSRNFCYRGEKAES